MPPDIPVPAQLSIRFLTLRDRVRARLVADGVCAADAAVLTELSEFGGQLDELAENTAIAILRLTNGTPRTRFAAVARMEARQQRRCS